MRLLMMAFLEANRSTGCTHSALLSSSHGCWLALSFDWQRRTGRATGAALTFIVLVVEAVRCIYIGIKGQSLWLHWAPRVPATYNNLRSRHSCN